MTISLGIAAVCLVLAIVTMCALGSWAPKRLSEKANRVVCWAMLLCCYGVCVGLISAILGYYFELSEGIALAIAVPLGLPALILACLMADS
jgi:hypothetical protein